MAQAKKGTTEKQVKKTTKAVKPAVAEKKAPTKVAPKTAKVEEKKVEAVAPVKKEAVEAAVAVETKKSAKTTGSLSVDVYDVTGKVTGKVSLPTELFGEKVNKELLAQAVRVYLANKRQGTVSTKTRGEVDGSSRKIYRQKGTGRARHGSVRAPIFVHGGIVHGPKPRDYSLELPKKMRRKALACALSAKLHDGGIRVIAGLEAIEPKTKAFMVAIKPLDFGEKRNVLIVLPGSVVSVQRAARNVTGITMTAARQLNAYDVLKAKNLLVMQDAIAEIEKTFVKKV
jgi:large subunit ribosomal protein L4